MWFSGPHPAEGLGVGVGEAVAAVPLEIRQSDKTLLQGSSLPPRSKRNYTSSTPSSKNYRYGTGFGTFNFALVDFTCHIPIYLTRDEGDGEGGLPCEHHGMLVKFFKTTSTSYQRNARKQEIENST